SGQRVARMDGLNRPPGDCKILQVSPSFRPHTRQNHLIKAACPTTVIAFLDFLQIDFVDALLATRVGRLSEPNPPTWMVESSIDVVGRL
ncbi:MAG TPA: hypothetical protein VMH23_14660, partial [Bacteroidota bacterium]|nr:hypothetical protein [Bacteroidota bacterium]